MLFQLRWLGSAEKDSVLFDNSFRGSKYKSENENFDYKKKLLEEKEAFVLFALSVTKNQKDACAMLSTDKVGLINYMKRYKINVGDKK